ncbi:MAG: restriction endonuclease subunit S [Acidobacteria bacterium]|nr:restriction endonuclease subunit S [Acidobacteriota bacterium]
MERFRLNKIGVIRNGIFARPSAYGNAAYLQSRHFGEYGKIERPIVSNVEVNPTIQKHLLEKGDVLVATKGTNNIAAVFDGSFLAVASTSLFVIRIMVPNILPEFLALSFNSPLGQKRLQKLAVGSKIVSIPKTLLATMEFNFPDLNDQKRILEIDKLSRKEKELRTQIADLRRSFVERQVARLIR